MPNVQSNLQETSMTRPTYLLRFRDAQQQAQIQAEAERAGMSLNEYILRKIEGPKLDISRRKIS
jgi:predicted HicB family RNase H-like nuclease